MCAPSGLAEVRALLSGPAGPAGAVVMLRRHALLEALTAEQARGSLVNERPSGAGADAELAEVLKGRLALATALQLGRRAADRLAYNRAVPVPQADRRR
eukprot:SAG22_NODE_4729_length_1180_cov_1.280296_1_plen_99_part_00